MSDKPIPSTGRLFDNGMEPWAPDDAECTRFASAMTDRGVSLGHSENVGVSVETAVANAARVAASDLDITIGIEDNFTKSPRR